MSIYRTFLFAPGNHPRRVEKALSLDADAVILDLEDACPIAEKVATRAVVVAACQRPRAGLGYIRVNATTTEFGFGDIAAVVQKGVDGIVLPKVEAADEIRSADWTIASLEKKRGLPVGRCDLIPIIETAKGMVNIRAIASAGTRVKRIAFGAGDFTLDMNMEWTRAETELLPYRSECVLASRAAGIEAPLDTVWVDLKDPEGFRASARHVKGLGFQGKMCIHPDQVPVANEVFTPSAAEVEWSRKAVAAFEAAEKAGSASIQLEGKFIDYPIVYRARRVLETMERIAARKKTIKGGRIMANEPAAGSPPPRGEGLGVGGIPCPVVVPPLPNPSPTRGRGIIQPSSRCRASASSTCRASSPARSARRSSPSSAPR